MRKRHIMTVFKYESGPGKTDIIDSPLNILKEVTHPFS